MIEKNSIQELNLLYLFTIRELVAKSICEAKLLTGLDESSLNAIKDCNVSQLQLLAKSPKMLLRFNGHTSHIEAILNNKDLAVNEFAFVFSLPNEAKERNERH